MRNYSAHSRQILRKLLCALPANFRKITLRTVEIDFLLSNESKTNFKIHPVEVKSVKNYTATSLLAFKEKFGNKIEKSYIIHPKNFSEENGIVKIPPYMVFCALGIA